MKIIAALALALGLTFGLTSLAGATAPLTSANWAGYVLTAGSGGYQSVGAEWTVPSVNCTPAPNGVVAVWVGVNGYSNNGLFQDGTMSYCVGGRAGYWTWWSDEAAGYSARYLFPINAGDLVHAQVYQDTSGHWDYAVTDITTGSSATAPESFSGLGTTAEWVVEDPEAPNTKIGRAHV